MTKGEIVVRGDLRTGLKGRVAGETRRIPIIAGTGANSTAEAVELAESAKKVGAAASLSVVPYYNKPTQEGLYRHYRAVAESTTLPVMVYNVPGRTASNMDAETTLALAEHANIVAVKEASGNMSQMAEICRVVPADFLVLSGDDALALPLMATSSVSVSTPLAGAETRNVATPRPPRCPKNVTGTEPGTGKVAKDAGAGATGRCPGALVAAAVLDTIHARPSFSTPLSTPYK